MKNGISVLLLSLGLIACGGESNKDNASAFEEFSSGIKGVEEQPSLTSADVEEGDSLNLNTNNHGNIEHYRSILLNFTLEQDTQVALVLSSDDDDLNLSISGHELNLDSSLDASNELIVFKALAGEIYSIDIDSHSARYEPIEGNSDFELKLVKANRASAGLTTDEYLVSMAYSITDICSENGEPEKTTVYSGSDINIINWKSEYFANSDGSDKQKFDSILGDAFTLTKNKTETGEDASLTSQLIATFNTDFKTGNITGSVNGTSHETNRNVTDDCRFTTTLTGRVSL